MKTNAIAIAGLLGFLGVALGAFGAHALKDTLSANGHLETYETATIYHLVHAVLLLGMGILAERSPSKWLNAGMISCIAGICIFAGSLYILAITDIKWLGAITPLGGLAFLFAWLSLAIHSLTSRPRS